MGLFEAGISRQCINLHAVECHVIQMDRHLYSQALVELLYTFHVLCIAQIFFLNVHTNEKCSHLLDHKNFAVW